MPFAEAIQSLYWKYCRFIMFFIIECRCPSYNWRSVKGRNMLFFIGLMIVTHTSSCFTRSIIVMILYSFCSPQITDMRLPRHRKNVMQRNCEGALPRWRGSTQKCKQVSLGVEFSRFITSIWFVSKIGECYAEKNWLLFPNDPVLNETVCKCTCDDLHKLTIDSIVNTRSC